MRPMGIFSKHFGLIHLADLGVLKHFFKKNSNFFSLLFHLVSCLLS